MTKPFETDPFETPLQRVQFYDKYARWNPEKQRRETWWETCRRVMDFFDDQLKARYGRNPILPKDWANLHSLFLRAEVLPSMRVVQMAGAPLERCNVGGYNCSYLPLEDSKDFADLLYILMQGTGVGFSVEQQYVDKWPEVIGTNPRATPLFYVVEDTTEGWCNAIKVCIDRHMRGLKVEFDLSGIRPHGTRLKTKGGIASGPRPLRNLFAFIEKTIQKRAGKKLRSIDLHDIACYCGQIVQVGGVRRAALISLSSIDDPLMQKAKVGKFWDNHPQRMMANNSAVYRTRQDFTEHFEPEFTSLELSGTGERGIFNRADLHLQMPPRRDSEHEFGLNPCAEIILRPRQFCNLSIAVTRTNDTVDTMSEKVRAATLFGMIQSLLTDFKYIKPEWKVNCEAERLLGVDITGQFDNVKLFTKDNLIHFHQTALDQATYYASMFKINVPAAVTCVKPSGNSSQLLNCSSGMHPRYAPYYIRRLRIGASTYMGKFLKREGVPFHPELGQDPENPTVLVFDFPVKSPDGNPTRNDVTAIDQLNYWLLWKCFYTEHNPSCTIYVRPDEWNDVREWVQKSFALIGGLSFLPYDSGSYELAPYEEITKEQYEIMMHSFPTINFDKFLNQEFTDHTTVATDYSCTSGSCDI